MLIYFILMYSYSFVLFFRWITKIQTFGNMWFGYFFSRCWVYNSIRTEGLICDGGLGILFLKMWKVEWIRTAHPKCTLLADF